MQSGWISKLFSFFQETRTAPNTCEGRNCLRPWATRRGTLAELLFRVTWPYYFTELLHDVMSIPAAAAVITANVAQPKYFSTAEFTCSSITFRLLVNRITSKMSGGANNPLITADQNSIFTAFNPR